MAKNEPIEIIKKEKQKIAVLVGLCTSPSSEQEVEKFGRFMRELSDLSESLGLKVGTIITQNSSEINAGILIGSGKVEEIKRELYILDADIVIFENNLSPMQLRNLEKAFDTEVIDRTGLILQIFSERARTREATLQVESARLQYLLPRLSGMTSSLSRQGGGSGRLSNKGSGEKKLELDRRHIEHRIAELRKELSGIDRERETQRNRRLFSGITRIALVGYTNAGKSTIMNRLLTFSDDNDKTSEQNEKQVFEKDMLFATLDTSVRSISIKGHNDFLLSDTVGFIDELPHTLVKTFRSTLEEVKFADILLEVIDFSDPEHAAQMEVTDKTLTEIGAGNIPRIYVFNKADLIPEEDEFGNFNMAGMMRIPYVKSGRVYICAKEKDSISALLDAIDEEIRRECIECDFLIPYSDGSAVNELTISGTLDNTKTEYLENGTRIHVLCKKRDAEKYSKYLIDNTEN